MKSLAEDAVQVTCGRGHTFLIQVWLFIDMEERPDHAAMVMDGSIRVFACPTCDVEVKIGDPLLIFWAASGGTNLILFAYYRDDDIRDMAGPLVEWFVRESGISPDEINIIPVPWAVLIPIMRRDIREDLETPDAYLDLPPELGASYRGILAELRTYLGLSWVTDLGDGDLPSCEHSEMLGVPDCPHCGKPFKARICLITTEKPGLARRIRNGDIQSAYCPHCGGRVQLGGLLLVWRPRRQPRILLSPVPGMTAELIQQSAQALLDVLQRQVGAMFREEWLSHATFLLREELAETLISAPNHDAP